MSISNDLMYAILAMDSYNRGYGEGISGLGGLGSKIGNATLSTDSETTPSTKDTAEAAGFYAAAYSYNGETVISYRGTDGGQFGGTGWELFFTDFPLSGQNDFDEPQVHLASKFYLSVAGLSGAGNITTTGHSLGGALNGRTGQLYGANDNDEMKTNMERVA